MTSPVQTATVADLAKQFGELTAQAESLQRQFAPAAQIVEVAEQRAAIVRTLNLRHAMSEPEIAALLDLGRPRVRQLLGRNRAGQ